MDRLIFISFLSPNKLYGRFPILESLAVNDLQFLTMVWNIFLALLPFGVYFLLKKYWRATGLVKFWQKISAVFLFIFWLFFSPNIAYITTDIRHLLNFCPVDSPFQVCPANAWMIIFFFTYSVIGWVLFYYNLKFMSGLIKEIFRKFWSDIFVIAMIPLTAVGVLLGLINRVNSWDIFLHPAVLWQIVWSNFSSFDFFIDWYIFTVFLYLLYFAGDAIFREIKE
jgi:uncharacterized membrane protein